MDVDAICLGDPNWGSALNVSCMSHPGIVLVQLRPVGPKATPTVVAIAACPDHVDAVQAWMVETWPHDDIWMDSLQAWVEGIQPAYAGMGYDTQLLPA